MCDAGPKLTFFLVRKDRRPPKQALPFMHSKGRLSVAGIFWAARRKILSDDNITVLPAII